MMGNGISPGRAPLPGPTDLFRALPSERRLIANFPGVHLLYYYSQRRPDRSIRPNHPRISIVPPAGAITVARSTPPKYLR
jgi:hypothetical protein